MSPKRGRVAVTISIPPAVAKEYDRIARATAKNRSELFRDMLDAYRIVRAVRACSTNCRGMERRRRDERGIRTPERDVRDASWRRGPMGRVVFETDVDHRSPPS